jgi:hypothetical protein
VICDSDCETISQFNDELNSCDHVEVVEVNTDRPSGDLVPGAIILLNQNIIARTSIYRPRRSY